MELDQVHQQVRSTTTQNQLLKQELTYVQEELAAKEAAGAQAKRRTRSH
jgi:hypothetical protein